MRREVTRDLKQRVPLQTHARANRLDKFELERASAEAVRLSHESEVRSLPRIYVSHHAFPMASYSSDRSMFTAAALVF